MSKEMSINVCWINWCTGDSRYSTVKSSPDPSSNMGTQTETDEVEIVDVSSFSQ